MILLPDPAATEGFGRALAGRLRTGDVIALRGDLGAGKTTLSRGVLRGLGYRGDVVSPTFPIVVAYEPPDVTLPLWHIDLYRIEDAEEIGELGLDEGRGAAALLIEWPDRLPRLWPEALVLGIETVSDTADATGRALTAQVPAAWDGRWPPT